MVCTVRDDACCLLDHSFVRRNATGRLSHDEFLRMMDTADLWDGERDAAEEAAAAQAEKEPVDVDD